MTQKLICSACGHVGTFKTATKGNLLIEIILWLSFLIPGIIYSIWRRSGLKRVCTVCKSENVIPVDTPVGKKLLAEHNVTLETVEAKPKPKQEISLKSLVIVLVLVIFVFPLIIAIFAG